MSTSIRDEAPGAPSAERSFSRDAIVYGVANALAKASAFALVPLITHRLSESSIGALALASTALVLMQTLSASGLDNAGGRWFYAHPSATERRRTVSSWLLAQSVLSFALALALGATVLVLAAFGRIDGELRNLCLVTAATIAASPIGAVAANWLRFTRRTLAAAALSVLGGVGSLVVALFLLLVVGSGAVGVAVGTLVAAVAASAVGFVALRGELSFADVTSTRLRELFSFGLPFLPGGVALWCIALSDRLLVQSFFGRGEVGRYQIAQTIASGVALITFAFQQVWGPWAFSRDDSAETRQMFGRALQVYLVAVGAFCIALSFVAREVLIVATTSRYHSLTGDVAILGVSNLVIGLMYIAILGPSIAKQTRSSGAAMVLGAIVNGLLNLALIPAFGVRGAAFATVIGYLVVATALFVAGQRIYPLPFNFVRSGATFVALGVACTTGVALEESAPGVRVLAFALALAITAMVGLGPPRHTGLGRFVRPERALP